jgi:hypothetical protein
VATLLKLQELGRMAILADLVAQIVFESGSNRIVAIETLWILISSTRPVAVLDAMARVALIRRSGVILMAVRTILPAVGAHIQFGGFIGMTVRTLLVCDFMFPSSCVRIVTIDAGGVVKVVFLAVAICALGGDVDF